MPLMNKIMKKYEQEAQEKIAEAQMIKKEKKKNRYSDKDGGEVLHDPKQGENSENTPNNGSSEKTTTEINSSQLLEKQQQEAQEKDINGVLDLCEGLQKANKALDSLKNNAEIIEEVERLRQENQQLKQKIEELEATEPTVEKETTSNFY